MTCLVRQWIHGLRQSWCLCRIFLLLYVKENSDPEVVCLALWRVGLRVTLNGKCAEREVGTR